MYLKAKNKKQLMIIEILCPFYFYPSVKLFMSDITSAEEQFLLGPEKRSFSSLEKV